MRMTPRLLVGIDTEGDNQWSAEAREHQTFENIYALPACIRGSRRTASGPPTW